MALSIHKIGVPVDLLLNLTYSKTATGKDRGILADRQWKKHSKLGVFTSMLLHLIALADFQGFYNSPDLQTSQTDWVCPTHPTKIRIRSHQDWSSGQMKPFLQLTKESTPREPQSPWLKRDTVCKLVDKKWAAFIVSEGRAGSPSRLVKSLGLSDLGGFHADISLPN